MNYKRVIWGILKRNQELLVGATYRPGDELRKGQLVLPGTELFYPIDETIKKEVKKCSGLDTISYGRADLKRRLPDLQFGISYFVRDGNLYVSYLDTDKEYVGSVVMLNPLDITQEPTDNPTSIVRELTYKSIDKVKKDLDSFTPACHVLLRILEEDGYL